MRIRTAAIALSAAGLTLAGLAVAQLNEVPMKGLGNEWVKQLDLKGKMDWEWIETYPSEVYFASRQAVELEGDVVRMWTRVEYRDPKAMPVPHRSVASRDAWDCAGQRQANLYTAYYRWNNLDDTEPRTSVTMLQDWRPVRDGTLGATLLEFACSLRTPAAIAVQPAEAAPTEEPAP
jgi:hypothetical protein